MMSIHDNVYSYILYSNPYIVRTIQVSTVYTYFRHKLPLADKAVASLSEHLLFTYLQRYCTVLIGVVQVPEDLVGIRWDKVVHKIFDT